MRLTCSRCGAEYEIDDALIPDSGREVECSSCDNVWFQPGAVAAAGTPPPPPAPPSRQLPEDLMAVLRDEAAQFRARHPHIESESAHAPPAGHDAIPAPGTAAGAERSDTIAPVRPVEKTVIAPETPITTGPLTAPGPATASAACIEAPIPPLAGDDEAGLAGGAGSDPARADQAAANASAIVAAAATAATAAGELPPAPSATKVAPARRRRRHGGFRQGFLIGLVIAALFFAAYMAAPHMGEGMAGDILRQIRAYGNEAHHWLHDKTDLAKEVFRRNLAEFR